MLQKIKLQEVIPWRKTSCSFLHIPIYSYIVRHDNPYYSPLARGERSQGSTGWSLYSTVRSLRL